MNPRIRINRAKLIESTPVDPSIRFTGPGLNSNKTLPYFTTLPYLNMFKNVFCDWNAGGGTYTNDEFEQLATLTNGGTCQKSIWAIHELDAAACLLNGNYTIKWDGTTGSDVVANVTGAGISGVTREDANTLTFDFTYAGSGDTNPRFHVQNVKSGGNTTFPITHVRCVFTDYIDLHEVDGEIFCPDYLALMPPNGEMLTYRGTGPLQIWGNPATLPEHIRPFEADAWGAFLEEYNPFVRFYTGMPYEVLAEMGKKKDCDITCPLPLGGNQATFDLIGTRLWSRLSSRPDVHVRLAVGNENWSSVQNNASYAGPLYLNAFAAASGGDCSGPAQAEAKVLLMAARGLLNAGFPREQIIITPELQLYGSWSVPFDGYGGQMMQYVDSEGLVDEDATFGSIIDAVHVGAYQHMNNGTDGFGGALFHWKLLALDWKSLSDSDILTSLQRDNDELTDVIGFRKAELADATGRTIPILTYEWGNEVNYAFENRTGVYPEFTVDTPNNKIVFEAGFPHPADCFSDGDIWRHENTYIAPAGNGDNYTGPNPGTCSTAIAHMDYVYIRRVDSNSARFYLDHAAAVFAYANDAAAKAAAIVLDNDFSNQVYTANNYTRWVEMNTRFTAFQESAAGGTAVENMLEATIGEDLLRQPTQYLDVGGWPYGSARLEWWGGQRGKYSTETPRHAVIRNFTA